MKTKGTERAPGDGDYLYGLMGLMTAPSRFCYLLLPVSLIFRRSDPCAKRLDSTGDARHREVQTSRTPGGNQIPAHTKDKIP
jgi:hypothetical protein